jgi:hypothetical protein
MGEMNWKELFRVERIQEQKQLDVEGHEAHDHPACLRAKGFKCVCKCCGVHHGALTRKGMSPLETYAKEPTIDTGPIERIFAASLAGLKGPIEFSKPVSRGLL